ncbi:MAG TPA: cell division protein FtsZ, partial [Sphingomicrobium sp.]|nr:cell division protein FtsZ [Sphingomicrobium sp.]
MSIDFVRPEVDELRPRICVIGVGGAGGNAVANMIGADVQGVDFIVANTDAQALNTSIADRRIQLGLKITQGLGAGSRPEIGRAADAGIDELQQHVDTLIVIPNQNLFRLANSDTTFKEAFE